MPFLKVTTDSGESWVLEYSGIGSIYELIAKFQDAERAKRYVEFENAEAGLIEAELDAVGKATASDPEMNAGDGDAIEPPKPLVAMFGRVPRAIDGASNASVVAVERGMFGERAKARLLSMLAQMADERGCIEIPLTKLSKICGISPGSTQRYIQTLIEKGEIHLVRPGIGNGNPAIYQLPRDLIDRENEKSATYLKGGK